MGGGGGEILCWGFCKSAPYVQGCVCVEVSKFCSGRAVGMFLITLHQRLGVANWKGKFMGNAYSINC